MALTGWEERPTSWKGRSRLFGTETGGGKLQVQYGVLRVAVNGESG